MKNLSDKFFTIVAAMAKDRTIGDAGKLPWHMPSELRHFKSITTGKVVIAGRKTYESLPKAALAGRQYVVVSRDPYYVLRRAEDILATDLEEAVFAAAYTSPSAEIMVIGGGEIFRQAAEFADRAIISTIDAEFQGDTEFQADLSGWRSDKEEEIRCETSELTATIHYLTRPADGRLTPCTGICSSSSLGDPVCAGCGRKSKEVDLWYLQPKAYKRLVTSRLKESQSDRT